jgi:hypothetical protein
MNAFFSCCFDIDPGSFKLSIMSVFSRYLAHSFISE